MLAAASAVHAKQQASHESSVPGWAVGEQREKQGGRIHELEKPKRERYPGRQR